ncbi:hypothetical protein FOXG_15324 [Fusarium oxysporum f. sp. lycopersici 4287]|uniref:Aminoglycoside phosphotransferase domain-containing protein n=2 Tax=Fusarium oxysporum TaxID=5507 RepID=A0A0J9WU60_FUSO4|nr:hypothetical protein FOXG_15324 [Fusarium oxysporum f. sp. lycopersici 4287]KNB17217.1 hypothetical protein FOXG_15324 [Fusarium oxysporum f. sp. lycopersici 4287]
MIGPMLSVPCAGDLLNVRPIEAINMLYVAKHTTIPVPRVYAIYRRKEDKKIITCILMEYIPGPLKSEREFVDAIIQSYAIQLGPRGAQKVRYYQRVLPAIFNGDNSSIFSHNDLQRKNIMVLDDGSLVIIDWEYASWSPVYLRWSSSG